MMYGIILPCIPDASLGNNTLNIDSSTTGAMIAVAYTILRLGVT
jgi:hypothetical protein